MCRLAPILPQSPKSSIPLVYTLLRCFLLLTYNTKRGRGGPSPPTYHPRLLSRCATHPLCRLARPARGIFDMEIKPSSVQLSMRQFCKIFDAPPDWASFSIITHTEHHHGNSDATIVQPRRPITIGCSLRNSHHKTQPLCCPPLHASRAASSRAYNSLYTTLSYFPLTTPCGQI